MNSICFLDGARFTDVPGLLRTLHRAIAEMPGAARHAQGLHDLLLGRAAPGPADDPALPARLHVVWLNSELSRRRLGAQALVPGGGGNAFDAALRWLAASRSVDLILL
ncbi:MAG TPA: hypothetical protein VFS40_12735 [Gemmatimonadales bacterium]|nr:hypothetical protein [Gemmatimonadales bacterium]